MAKSCSAVIHTTKGSNNDLTFYIQQSAEILGVTAKLKPEHRESPKHIIEFLFKQVSLLLCFPISYRLATSHLSPRRTLADRPLEKTQPRAIGCYVHQCVLTSDCRQLHMQARNPEARHYGRKIKRNPQRYIGKQKPLFKYSTRFSPRFLLFSSNCVHNPPIYDTKKIAPGIVCALTRTGNTYTITNRKKKEIEKKNNYKRGREEGREEDRNIQTETSDRRDGTSWSWFDRGACKLDPLLHQRSRSMSIRK